MSTLASYKRPNRDERRATGGSREGIPRIILSSPYPLSLHLCVDAHETRLFLFCVLFFNGRILQLPEFQRVMRAVRCGRSSTLPCFDAAWRVARRFFFVKFRETPNELCFRFDVPGVSFLPSSATDDLPSSISFTRDTSHASPLAQTLLTSLPMVEEVTVGPSFVTVRQAEKTSAKAAAESFIAHFTKHNATLAAAEDSELAANQEEELDPNTVENIIASSTWGELTFHVSALLTDHLYSGQPHVDLNLPHPHADTLPCEGDSEVLLSIKEWLRRGVRPILQEDGGDLRYVHFNEDEGLLQIELLGSCKRCLSSRTTLYDLIERTTSHWVPEVKRVEEVNRVAEEPLGAEVEENFVDPIRVEGIANVIHRD